MRTKAAYAIDLNKRHNKHKNAHFRKGCRCGFNAFKDTDAVWCHLQSFIENIKGTAKCMCITLSDDNNWRVNLLLRYTDYVTSCASVINVLKTFSTNISNIYSRNSEQLSRVYLHSNIPSITCDYHFAYWILTLRTIWNECSYFCSFLSGAQLTVYSSWDLWISPKNLVS